VISGPGEFFLKNSGQISKSSSIPQSLSFLSPSSFVNTGTLSLQAGSLLLDFTDIQQAGEIYLAPPENSSTLIVGVSPFLNDGLIAGNGRLTWVREPNTSENTLINRGVIRPGGSIGSLVIAGNFLQEPSEGNANPSLEFEVAGGTPGEYDTLVVQGGVELDGGSLRVDLINDYEPQSGDQFNLISGNPFTIAGGFEEVFPSNVSFERVLVGQAETISYVVRTSSSLPEQPVGPPTEPPVEPPVQPPVVQPPVVQPPVVQPPVVLPPTLPETPISTLPPPPPQTPTPIPPVVSPPPGLDPRPPSTPASQRRVEAPGEGLLLVPPLIDQNIFLAALGQEENELRLFESSELEEDLDVSFLASGEGVGDGEVGSARTLSSQEALGTFLAKEELSYRYTASRLGLVTPGATTVPSPEELQRLLQEVASWVRSGHSSPRVDLR
jgi:hypothetical protein